MTRMQEQAQRKKSKGQGKSETYKEQNLPDQQIPVLTLFAVQVYLTLGAHGMLCSLRLEQILQSQRYVRSWSCPCTPRSLKNTKRQKVQCSAHLCHSMLRAGTHKHSASPLALPSSAKHIATITYCALLTHARAQCIHTPACAQCR